MRCSLLTSTALLAFVFLAIASASEQKTTKEYIQEANELLLRGKYSDAIKSYDTAIEKDPQNYLTYFKRATTLLTLSKHASAIRDFSRAIELKLDFDQAYYQRAKAYLKEGSYDGASNDIAKVFKGNKDKKLLATAKELKEKIALAKRLDTQIAQEFGGRKYDECVKTASKLVKISPLYIGPLKTRAACRIAVGDLEGASADLGRLVRISPNDLETLDRLANLYFVALNERNRGMEYIRMCLKSDPDNKPCKSTYMQLRGLERKISKLEEDRSKKKWNACNRVVAPVSGKGGLLEDVDGMYAQFIVSLGSSASAPSKLASYLADIACEGYSSTKKWDHALINCKRALDADPNNIDALIRQFDAQYEGDELDQARTTIGRLEQIVSDGRASSKQQQSVREQRMRLENKKRMIERKDYYKILGVARDATSTEIKRAHRKMAQQWHPDRYRGDLPKEKVEEKMAEVNEAYELLMDEEKRAQFDQGHDPNDPTGGAHAGGPFGSGGFGAGNPFVFQQGGGRPVFFQDGPGKHFSFQFGGSSGFPF
ncbi:hypothetical protein GGI25_001363 [Coemansia spiralis]|uniref:J domain-containing protein n=2 Tax=Coemansia TaxID=4863 RepID=A0A9W8KYK2_9FUNG|nr:hypothetical protein BX070DRAFT_223401 [Coemansia spiralis]KAJ1995136.1 hypothetical protein EDC05_001227 [Coemansia umbellata]KAJ2624065.1 hypothetical protein GGI26_001858 [Coemansia sp. RSA 1358]KAJ2679673.1 hypothetical protein GGI25_001363 [Coemansia spiralis]